MASCFTLWLLVSGEPLVKQAAVIGLFHNMGWLGGHVETKPSFK